MPRVGARFDIDSQDRPHRKTSVYFAKESAGECVRNNKEKERCIKCIYGCKVQGFNACQYILVERKMRPCLPESKGNRCKAFIPIKGHEERFKEIRRSEMAELQRNGYLGRMMGDSRDR